MKKTLPLLIATICLLFSIGKTSTAQDKNKSE